MKDSDIYRKLKPLIDITSLDAHNARVDSLAWATNHMLQLVKHVERMQSGGVVAILEAVDRIPTPTLVRMLAFRDRPECAAEVAFAVAALRARGVEVAEPEPPTQPSSELAALQNVRATPTPETHGNALAPTQPSIAPGPGDGAPRCSVCGNLCIDIAKDEHGACPNCSTIEWEERPDLNDSDDFEVIQS